MCLITVFVEEYVSEILGVKVSLEISYFLNIPGTL